MDSKEPYKHLFQQTGWGSIEAEFVLDMPKESLISNVSIVPFIDRRCVVIRWDDGTWEVPGGTLEQGEHYRDAVRRELMEEAGAVLHTYKPFGAWKCFSHHPQPYKPHLPHPEFYRLVGYGDVEICSQPQIPDDGEKVVAVEVMSVDEAAAAFRQQGRLDLADLYRLAERLRSRSVFG